MDSHTADYLRLRSIDEIRNLLQQRLQEKLSELALDDSPAVKKEDKSLRARLARKIHSITDNIKGLNPKHI